MGSRGKMNVELDLDRNIIPFIPWLFIKNMTPSRINKEED